MKARDSRLFRFLVGALLLGPGAGLGCGGEDEPDPQLLPTIPPNIEVAVLLTDGEVNPGLSVHIVRFGRGRGPFDVELFYYTRTMKSEDDPQPWVPVPESAILEWVPTDATLEGNLLSGFNYDEPGKQVVVLFDLRTLAHGCEMISLGMRVFGSERGIEFIHRSRLYTWPHSHRAEMELELTGEGEYWVEQEGEHYYVDVPLRPGETPRITYQVTGIPTEDVPDPTVNLDLPRFGGQVCSLTPPSAQTGSGSYSQ